MNDHNKDCLARAKALTGRFWKDVWSALRVSDVRCQHFEVSRPDLVLELLT